MKQFKSKRKRSFNNGFSRNSRRPYCNKKNLKFYSKKKVRGKEIDIQRFVQKAISPIAPNSIEIRNSFRDFNFCQGINQNLTTIGFTSPTSIQDQSIKHIMSGRDLVGLANTGTGKTAAFLLPLIDKCFKNKNQKVLIIAPTRELAQQIDQEFKKFSSNMRLYSAICVGGISIFKQISDLKRNPNFVIGTPGRLKDLNKRSRLSFSIFQNIILDEIDRMLDMGFIEEIRQILAELPQKRQSLFFSATIPPKIETLIKQFLQDPVTIKTTTSETPTNVDQDIIKVEASKKLDHLKNLLSKESLKKVLIFSETKRDVEKLSKNLTISGFKADSIHSNKRQNQRQKALTRFKENQVQILVATDVAARGLDINNISHVINYTVPQTYNDYIHRIGRTGRFGQKGIALTFINN